METKKCNRCLEVKALELFFKDKSHSSGRYSICKECKKNATYKWRIENRENYNSVARKWRKNHKLNCRNYSLKKNFKINQKQFEEMLADQNGGCKICGKENCAGRYLNIDHCHKTGKIRGLLCNNCNKGLGQFQDSPELLEKAKQYLTGG